MGFDALGIGRGCWLDYSQSERGNMIDRDWQDPDKPGIWTDESRHPDTCLNFANEFDLNIKGWLLNEPDYRLGLMAGYQESCLDWPPESPDNQYHLNK
uniref:Protease 7 n=1 Tax=Escherichia coli TaxID=562 RepID=A0A343J192_ECOLX|nr:Protease 7 [Escherichia coli]